MTADDKGTDGAVPGAGQGHKRHVPRPHLPHRHGHGHEPQRLEGQPRRGHPWWVTAVILLGVAIVLLAAFIGPTFASSTSSYCSSCKQMKAPYESWSKSIHSGVSCERCHVQQGVVAKLRWRWGEAANIWAGHLGAEQSMHASQGSTPTNAVCLSCHPFAQLPPVVNGIRMPHQTHVQQHNLDCVDCHPEVSHGGPGAASTVSMATCTMCHNGAAAPSDCGLCHVTPPPQNVHPADYLKTHGIQSLGHLDDCLRCHHDKAGFCDTCHARPPVSHFAGDWRYSHGTAAKTQPTVCAGCHDQQAFCQQCHQVDHPSDWATTHAAVAAKGVQSCLVCHPQSMCDECHRARGVQP